LHAQYFEGGLHVIELERLDDRGDELHASTLSLLPAWAGT
jgi:hypothetical protein